ncbi:hypothetical protein [Methanothrix sp.]|uniref:hypothetical protein n=1 Tax=Methanothrix sp. TaxID=90426 RepID=UPI003C70BD6E
MKEGSGSAVTGEGCEPVLSWEMPNLEGCAGVDTSSWWGGIRDYHRPPLGIGER